MKPRLPFSTLARKSVADVTRRKGRTVLVVLGIVIGVFGLTAINTAAGALGAAFAYSADEAARANIIFSVVAVDPSLAPILAEQPNVKTVQIGSFYRTRWQIQATPGHANIGIYGVPDFANVRINPFQITSGRAPGPGEIVMESSDRSLQQFAVGDTVTVDTPDGPQHLRVVGLARTLGTPGASLSNSAIAYMSADGLNALSGATQPNRIDVVVRDTSALTVTARALDVLLQARGIQIRGVSMTSNDFDPGPITGLFIIMRVLSLIALLLTGFLIVNTVTTLVAEQTRIIGAMKAIGATRGTVMRGYLTTVAVYGVVGTALGVALGVVGGYQFAAFLANLITLDLGPYQPDAGMLLLSVAVGLGIPFLAALIPLWNGTRITVREAMAAYGVSAGGNGKRRGAFGRRLAWVPQTTWLGLRGIFRRRGRAVLTLLALTLSATAFLSIQTTTYAVNTFMGHLFDQYGFDAFVGTNPQPYDQVRARMLTVPNVAAVERFEQDGVKTDWGTLRLQGVEPDTQMYHYEVVRGRWFNGNEPNVMLISEAVAQKTGLTVGDTMQLTSLTTGARWKIIGIVHDLNGGLSTIGTGFTTIDNLHSFLGVPADVASSFMVRARDHSPAAVDQMATALDNTLGRAGLAPVVATASQQIQRNQSQFQILYVLLYAVAAIVALVGILGLFNTLTTSVLERRREIGILRSMGATGWRVASVFWTEGLALAGIAWLVAVILGIPAAYGFVALLDAVLLPIPFAFSPVSILVMLLFVALTATLASAGPALSAARVRIADTLRYE